MNKFITAYKDNHDTGDKWGSSMIWAFALCDWMADNINVPDYWEFSQSCLGSDSASYEYKCIEELFSFKRDSDLDDIQYFSRFLKKYTERLRLAGESY